MERKKSHVQQGIVITFHVHRREEETDSEVEGWHVRREELLSLVHQIKRQQQQKPEEKQKKKLIFRSSIPILLLLLLMLLVVDVCGRSSSLFNVTEA